VLIVHAGTAVSTHTRGSEGNSYNLIRVAPNHLSAEVMCWAAGKGFRGARTCSYAFNEGRWGRG